MSERKPSVFISYSHKDEEWKDKLVRQLRIPAEQHGFEVWHDGQIQVGDDWRERIGAALESTQIAVLLISDEFLNSEFIKAHEVPLLLELRQQGRVEVVPVLVGACPWKSVGWLERLELRPKDGEPLESLSIPAQKKALVRVAEEIDAKLTQAAKRAERERARARAVVPRPAGASGPGQEPEQPVELERERPKTPRESAPQQEPSPARPDPPKPAAAPLDPQPAVRAPSPKPVVVVTTPEHGRSGRRLSWLRSAVWLIGLTVLALGLYLWMRAATAPSPPSPTPQAMSLTAFEFDTVTVDARGSVVERRRRSAEFYEEDLGGDVKLAMVAIPGGTFVMGSPASEAGRFDWEGPTQEVTVAPFFLGKFEVTQAQWRAVARWPQVARVLAEAPSHFKGDDLPVEQVSWHDTVEFCARLSRRTGRTYRLPSEAEWEYAARAGTTTPFHFGLTITPALVNYDSNHPYAQAAKGEYRRRTTPVGSFDAGNAFGLFDMHGNVWEWVEDDWHATYEGAPIDGRARAEPTRGSARVIRGGSWVDSARYVRAAYRAGARRMTAATAWASAVPEFRSEPGGCGAARSGSTGPSAERRSVDPSACQRHTGPARDAGPQRQVAAEGDAARERMLARGRTPRNA